MLLKEITNIEYGTKSTDGQSSVTITLAKSSYFSSINAQVSFQCDHDFDVCWNISDGNIVVTPVSSENFPQGTIHYFVVYD